MSDSLSKWQRKRSVEDDEESEDAAMIEFDEESSEKERDWKPETPDEILQEKRPRFDDREESAVEGTKQSSRTSSPSSVKRLSISSSPSHHSRSSSKHDSPGEVIYQLSPEQHNLSPLSSGSRTPSKKPKSPNDAMQSKTEKKRSAEEEEGEIVSDISDDERKERRRKKSVDIQDAKSSEALENKGTTSGKTSRDESTEESSEEESSDEESEEEEVGKVAKEDTVMGRGKVENEEENSNSDGEGESGESSDEEEEDEETKGNKTKQEGEGEESVDESSDESEEEESSSAEGSEDEEEQKSDIKEQIKENEKATAVVEDETEGEDLHKELKKLKDKKSLDEKQRQTYRSRDEEHSRGSSWRKESRLKDSGKERGSRERKPYSQDKAAPQERSYSREKFHRDDRERRVVSKEKTDNSKPSREKTHRSSGSKGRMERARYGEKERPLPVRTSSDADRRASRKDYNKHKSSKESSKKESKPRVKRDTSERVPVPKESKDKVSEDTKIPKEDAVSSVLTEKERRQFNREVVDLDSEESSTEEESALAPTSDVEMKSEGDEDRREKEDEQEDEDEEERLPPYLPAVQGCRNVEEFQWLNRIEEGSYGVVYRAKDRRSGEVVALKKLKMEREKGGFPITSLREINTLLKAQHVNIVTVREIVVGSNMDKIYIVMDYVEHDLKTLMEHMTTQFRMGEVKTLLIQLLRAVAHLHDKWILHRDLKTSNLLLSNQGILKVGDFGLAREYGSPLKNYTPIVVTLWYRAPELLLGVKEYSTPIDLWSVGCIFAELLTMKPLFTGSSEIDQINKIFQELGTPSDKIWPGPPAYSELPFVKKMTFAEYPYNNLRNKFGAYLTDKGFDLLNRFLTYDPKKRITADDALKHHYFEESPSPVDPSFFPTWPARSEMMKRPKRPKDYEHSPDAPEGGAMFAKLAEEGDGSGNGAHGFRMPSSKKGSAAVAGFTLKF